MTAIALIKSKLRPPVISKDIVARARLLNSLDYHRPLTLIVAPAGYGKTTLMANWIARARYPCAWLALDVYDDSVTAFMTYLLAALETVFPGACLETRALLNSSNLPAPRLIAQALVNELEELPHGAVLILDDYYTIQDPAIQQIMAEFLRYQPQNIELVLLTRHDPPLHLAELRMRNRITELRAQDLRFSPEESKAFLHEAISAPLDEGQVGLLAAVTEGWPAGVRMTAMLLQQQRDVSKVLADLEASDHYAARYLVDEVFERMAPALQAFLLQTAHMEQVCAALCAAVIGGDATVEQCQANLATLAKQNLFVFALDSQGVWHRYHHLFRTVLQHRARQSLAPGAIEALHGRASRWLAAHGQVEAAIAHAVRSGDVQAVADLVGAHRHDLLNAENWAALETWLSLIPRSMIDQHPQLLILDAWRLSRRALLPELNRRLEGVDSLLAATQLADGEVTALRGEVDALLTQILYWAGDSDGCTEAGRRALRDLPQDYAFARHLARLFLVAVLEIESQASADAVLAEGVREARQQPIGPAEAREIATAGLLSWVRADMGRMDEYANLVAECAQARGSLEFVAWGRYLRACARYQQNDLAGVERDFTAVVEAPFVARPFTYSQSFLGLAATCQALGKFDQAYQHAQEGVAFAEECGNPLMAARAQGFLAHLSFRQGKIDEALRWLAQPSRIPLTMPIPTFHAAPVGRAAILLGLGDAAARAEADELLEQLRDNLERFRNTRFLIEVLALQAFSLDCTGNREAALDLLERAVRLTIPGTTLRALADLDHLVGPLLAQVAARSGIRSQVARIRRAAAIFPATSAGSANGNGLSPHPVAAPVPVRHPDLLEPLTFREMDVLLLLQDRPSNKEIAQQLCIATETVKRHLTNIYLKLHVQSRRQALAKAREMGILPPK